MSCAGPLDNLPATASRLSFVGTGANGDQQGTAILRYADGSTDVIDLSFTDWTISGGRGSLQFGNEIVARTAYRNIAGSAREDVVTYVFATQPVPIPTGKRHRGDPA